MRAPGLLSATRLASSPGVAVAIAVTLAVTSLPAGDSQPTTIAGQLLCCLGAGIAFLYPLLGSSLLSVTLLAIVVVNPGLYQGTALFAFPIAIASCAARGQRFAGLVFGLWYLALFITATSRFVESTTELAANINILLVIIFAPLLLGELFWRMQRRTEVQRRAQRLDAERQLQSIARDLHDTLAYATTAMVMKAEQARLRGGQDEQTLADLDYIATTGRSVTADLRTILAVLRESAKDGEPGGGSLPIAGVLEPTRLEEVVEAQRSKLAAFHFDANVSLNGDPAIPDYLAAVLARGVTEVASNITKHGDQCSEVSIMIDIGPDDVELVAVNTPRPTPADSGQRGLGLLGLREVVEAVGGNLESGKMGNRWITHLTLPLRGRDRV